MHRRKALPSPRGEGAERSEADEVERSRPPPVPPVVPPNPTTPHPSRRTAAPPSPQGEGLQAPLWLHRCSDALGEAVYTSPQTPGAPSRAASSRRDRPLTSVSKQSAHTVSPPRTHGHRYASAHDGSGAKHTSHRRICVPPPFICKVIMHSDNFLHQFILVRIICQAVFLRPHKKYVWLSPMRQQSVAFLTKTKRFKVFFLTFCTKKSRNYMENGYCNLFPFALP